MGWVSGEVGGGRQDRVLGRVVGFEDGCGLLGCFWMGGRVGDGKA